MVAQAVATVALPQRVLAPNELHGYTAVLGAMPLRTGAAFREEVGSLCINVEPARDLERAGFIMGYEESLARRANPAGTAVSIAAQFRSRQDASDFLGRDDRVCGSPTAQRRNSRLFTRLAISNIPHAIGYRVATRLGQTAGRSQYYYWEMFSTGRYAYIEALVSGGRQAQLIAAADSLYKRVREP